MRNTRRADAFVAGALQFEGRTNFHAQNRSVRRILNFNTVLVTLRTRTVSYEPSVSPAMPGHLHRHRDHDHSDYAADKAGGMCSSVRTSRGSQVVKHVGRLIGLLAVNLNLEHVVQFVFVHENLRKRGASLLWHASCVPMLKR